jgi:hypothetical protein
LFKSCQKVAKKLSKNLFDFRKGLEDGRSRGKIKKGRKKKKKKEKNEGFPRPGGDFVAPGKNVSCIQIS